MDDLFPDEGSEFIELKVDQVDDLIPGWDEYTIMPDKRTVDSVRQFGVLSPILLIRKKRGDKYEIAAGRRRLRAAKIVERPVITARVFPYGWTTKGVLTLVENEVRKKNPLSEWKAIEDMLKDGKTEQEIIQLTGIQKQTLDKLLGLRNLTEPLLTAFLEGKLSSSVAFEAAQQRPKVQKALAKQYDKEGKLRKIDIGRVRKVVKTEAVNALPFSVFSDEVDWKTKATSRLIELKKEIRAQAPTDVLTDIDALLDKIQKTVVGTVVNSSQPDLPIPAEI